MKPTTKAEMFKYILDIVDEAMSHNGCNDVVVTNTPELFEALEQAGADNVRMTLEEFRADFDSYNDYAPRLSIDKTEIYTNDFTVLGMIKKELGLK